MITETDLEALRQRLGPADEVQIRTLLKMPPEQRILTMLRMQAMVVNMWRERLRRNHPELSGLELCRMMFDRLQNNKKYHDP